MMGSTHGGVEMVIEDFTISNPTMCGVRNAHRGHFFFNILRLKKTKNKKQNINLNNTDAFGRHNRFLSIEVKA